VHPYSPVQHLSELTVTQLVFMKNLQIPEWIFINFDNTEFNGKFLTRAVLD
jgi:hypothetical protein